MSRRHIAIAIVLCTAAVAHGALTITPSAPSAGIGSAGTQMRAIFSVRNTAKDEVVATITPGCTGLALTDITGTSATQWSFGAGEQRQFIVQGSFATPGVRTCQWTVAAPGQPTAQVTTTFDVDPANQQALTAQPAAFDFAVTGTSETQLGYLQNYALAQQAFAMVAIDDGGTNVMQIDGGPCNGMKTCAGAAIPGGSFRVTGFKCTPPATGQVTGTITYMLGGGNVRTHAFACRRAPAAVLDVMPVILEGPGGTPVTAIAQISASAADALQTATIVGTDAAAFAITQAPCPGTQSCTFTPPRTAPTTLAITCTPGTAQKTARLRVTGTAGANDIDEAELRCVADGGASTNVSVLDFGDVRVMTTSAPRPVTITNLSATAPITITVDTGDIAWLVDACATPCTIAAGGTQTVQVRFEPELPARADRVLRVLAGSTTIATVALRGNGVGSRLRVTNLTAPYLLDLGTVGLATRRARDVTLAADGNRSLNVALGTPAAPFSLSTPAVDLAADAEGTFDIRCQSATPGMFTAMVTLSPGPDTHVYAADTPKIDVRCRVANTVVRVAPDELDFGEKRRTDPPETLEIEITNPGTQPISLDYVRLTDDTALTLTAPTGPTLAPGETVMASLTLSTATELALDTALEVGVGGEQLVTPIMGKVVTASARVTPATLRLGSVCVGTTISESVTLANIGTANLRAQPPVMDGAFAVMFASPVSYPEAGALLAPLEEATATVTLSTRDSGPATGTLTWDIDAPEAPFVIEASVEVKADGTAISPQAVGFDQVRVDERSERRTVRLENCGDVATTVTLLGVDASRGDARAWEVTPATETTFLQPGDKLALDVFFAPVRTGPHRAVIELLVDDVREEIELTGEGIGDAVERKSLYGCDCNTSAPPPVALVLVVLLVIFRRRTGSS